MRVREYECTCVCASVRVSVCVCTLAKPSPPLRSDGLLGQQRKLLLHVLSGSCRLYTLRPSPAHPGFLPGEGQPYTHLDQTAIPTHAFHPLACPRD